jgi:broad specificity phosphatase PhoE
MNEQIIILARHGQTDFNLEKKVQDHVNPRLTKLGHQQARAIKKEIEKLRIVFDLIICSDMTRNIETLTEIYPNYKKIDNVKIDSRLQERYHRDLVGKTKNDIEKEIGKKFTDRFSWELYFEGTEKSELTKLKCPNDETLDSVKNRLASLFSELKNKNKILLIGSSIFNQYILEFLSAETIGINKPQSPDGHVIDFQENNELRIVTLDENMKIKNYSSIKY